MIFRPLPWLLLNGPSLGSAVVGGVVATLAVVATVVTFCPNFHNRKKVGQIYRSNFWHLNPKLKSYKNNIHLKKTHYSKKSIPTIWWNHTALTLWKFMFFMPWDSAGETWTSGGWWHHFVKFPGCISKEYNYIYIDIYIIYDVSIYKYVYRYIYI